MIPGWTEILVIGSVIVIAVSFKKLPALVHSMKKSLKSFKEGVSEEERRIKDVTPPSRLPPDSDA